MVAGALSLDDALKMVATRATLMTQNCHLNHTGMMACNASSATAKRLFTDHERMSQLGVACNNGEDDCVIAGPLDALSKFAEHCSDRDIKTKKLGVPYGFHSSAMEPILDPLRDLGELIKWRSPLIPIASNVHGRLLDPQDLRSDYFALHARQPVLFAETIQALHRQGLFDTALCLEIGPHPITLPMLRRNLPADICSFISTLQKDRDSWTTLSAALNQISFAADGIDWRKVFEGSGARMTNLPGHPLQLKPSGVSYQEKSLGVANLGLDSEPHSETGQRLLPKLLTARSSDNHLIFETSTHILGPLIAGHNVGGICICPASLFHELILEAAQVALIPTQITVLTVYNLSFHAPFIYEPAELVKPVHVSIRRVSNISKSGDITEIEVTIKTPSKATEEILCCSAVAKVKATKELEHLFLKNAAIVSRQSRHLVNSNDLHSTFQTKLLYEKIFTRVVSYSPDYQALKSFSISDSDLEGVGTFQVPMKSRITGYLSNPVFTDTLLHAAGFMANLTVPADEICICGHVETIEILYDRIDYSGSFSVYCSLINIIKGTIFADAYAVDVDGKVVARVKGMEFKPLRLSSYRKILDHTSPKGRPGAVMTKEEQLIVEDNETFVISQARATSPPTPTVQPHQQELKREFQRIVGDVYGTAEGLDSNQSLVQLGIDSMMQIEITAKLSQAFPHSSLDHDLLFNCDTLQESEDRLLSMMAPQLGSSKSGTPIKTPNKSTVTIPPTFFRQ